MPGPHIEVRDEPARHRYEVVVDGQPAGFTTYRLEPGRVTFLHTEIDDRFEGQGVGSSLARFVLDDAGRRSLLVTPVCPFIAGYIQRHPEYLDLVAEEDRVWVPDETGHRPGIPGARPTADRSPVRARSDP
jgi:predicted GNAT family acetyltransferase